MTGPTLTGLALVRDHLAEARRFTHTKPDDADRYLNLTIDHLNLMLRQRRGPRLMIIRVGMNLIRGQRCIRAAPEVTDAYITGALWELGDHASRLRKAAEAEGRDAELMEAYGPREELG